MLCLEHKIYDRPADASAKTGKPNQPRHERKPQMPSQRQKTPNGNPRAAKAQNPHRR
jgi:hypothetical protein